MTSGWHLGLKFQISAPGFLSSQAYPYLLCNSSPTSYPARSKGSPKVPFYLADFCQDKFREVSLVKKKWEIKTNSCLLVTIDSEDKRMVLEPLHGWEAESKRLPGNIFLQNQLQLAYPDACWCLVVCFFTRPQKSSRCNLQMEIQPPASCFVKQDSGIESWISSARPKTCLRRKEAYNHVINFVLYILTAWRRRKSRICPKVANWIQGKRQILKASIHLGAKHWPAQS